MPSLMKFSNYLEKLRGMDGLLPVENLGVPTVWIDSEAYNSQRHKICSFNIYAAAMYKVALEPLCELSEVGNSKYCRKLSSELMGAVVEKFWHKTENVFIVNLPWLNEERTPRYSDRSLAMALLYGLCPENKTERSVEILAECPKELGQSYPANAVWRLRALAKYGRIDIVLNEIRNKWAKLEAVLLNNTLPEGWFQTSDDSTQWSHAAIAPLLVLYMDIAGIRPLKPGFEEIVIRPQLQDIS
jgi:alpha-L-rhamnosidase